MLVYIILFQLYYRTSGIHVLNCRASKSLEIVKHRYLYLKHHLETLHFKKFKLISWFLISLPSCDSKGSCSIPANNQVFGDPCYGTHKYLEVHYQCVKSQGKGKGLAISDACTVVELYLELDITVFQLWLQITLRCIFRGWGGSGFA